MSKNFNNVNTNDNKGVVPVQSGTPSFREGRGNKLNLYGLANYLIEHHHIITLQDRLYIYDNGIYVNDMKLIKQLILRLSGGATSTEINKVLENLSVLAPTTEETSYKFVAFNNCIVNIDTLQTFDFSPDEYVITSKIYANYDTTILTPNNPAIKFVKSFFDVICNCDSGLKTLLYEIIGYCMLRTAKYHYAFILKGTSNNGKSDYLHIIEHLLGDFCSHQTFEQLSKTTSLMSLYKRTANIVDDKREIKKVDFSRLHSIVSGGTLSVKVTDTEEFAFAPYSTLLVASNHYLYFKNCHREDMRRFWVIPFIAELDGRRDVDMTENICSPENLDVIATLAIQAFNKVATNENKDTPFHFPELVKSTSKTFYLQANPVLEFITSHPIKRLVSKFDYFSDFCKWCNRNNLTHTENDSTFGTKVIAYGYDPKPHTFKVEGEPKPVKDTYYQVLGYNIQDLKNEYAVYCNSLDKSDTPMTIIQYILYLYEQDISE